MNKLLDWLTTGIGILLGACIIFGMIALKLRWFILAAVIVALTASYVMAGGMPEQQQAIIVMETTENDWKWITTGVLVPIIVAAIAAYKWRKKS